MTSRHHDLIAIKFLKKEHLNNHMQAAVFGIRFCAHLMMGRPMPDLPSINSRPRGDGPILEFRYGKGSLSLTP